MNSPTILIIDDETQIRKLLEITLSANNFKVHEASTGKEGLISAATRPPDMILLEHSLLFRLPMMLPNILPLFPRYLLPAFLH